MLKNPLVNSFFYLALQQKPELPRVRKSSYFQNLQRGKIQSHKKIFPRLRICH